MPVGISAFMKYSPLTQPAAQDSLGVGCRAVVLMCARLASVFCSGAKLPWGDARGLAATLDVVESVSRALRRTWRPCARWRRRWSRVEFGDAGLAGGQKVR